MQLTSRFEDALLFATRLHITQARKGTATPYIAHLLSVTALVLEHDGSEDEAIAALLHDAAEDQGGYETLDEIRTRFGETVAAIVAGCTDSYHTPKPPWRARKEAYLAHLRTASPQVVRVSLADKLHNSRSILTDFRLCGDVIFERFTGGQAGTLWYYRALADSFATLDAPPALLDEFQRVVAELEQLVD